MRKLQILAATAGTLVAIGVWATGASAHVTPEPSTAPKGAGDQVITFRVPNEEDAASTVSLKLQLPQDHPIAAVDALDDNGWTSTVEMQHLATPLKTDDGSFSDVASTITWTGGKIAPGHYGEFKILAMGLPEDTDSLTFKAIQTYDDGKTVSWIETQKDAEHPAAVVKLTAAESDTAAATPASTTTSSSSDSSKGLAVAALIVGVLALLVGAGAIINGRKSGPAST